MGVNSGLAGALHRIDLHEIAIEFDFRALEAAIFGQRTASDRSEKRVSFHRFPFAVGKGDLELHPVLGDLNILGFGAGFDANSLLFKQTTQFLRNFLVLHRNDARQHLENLHFRAEAVEAGREFDAHCARAQHRQVFVGTSGKSSISMLVRMRLASGFSPGSMRAAEPVAGTTFFVS